ncbi:MAG: MFS transporter [Campylobacteraceae bacterium]|nr:MFS transporter [Campylobacteraceae bacterium]
MIFLKLAAFYFFYFAAVGVYVIFMPKVLYDLNYTSTQIGILFALAPLMRFLTPFIFLKHIKLNANVFKLALLASLISSSLFYLTIDNFYAFMINNSILGVSLSLILPYMEIIALKDLGKNNYGKARLFGSIGFMLVALVLARYLSNPYMALHFYLIANIFTVIISLSLLKHDVSHKEKNTKTKFSFIKYWQFWLSLFFMQMSFSAFYNFFTIYESENMISLETISYMWSFAVLMEIFMLYFQAPLLKKNLKNIILFCISLTVIRWLLLFFFASNEMIVYFSQALHAFSFALYHSCVIMFLYTLYENKKLAQQFMYGVAYGLGGFIGGIVSGYLYGEFLFLYSSIFALCSLYFMLQVKKEEELTY